MILYLSKHNDAKYDAVVGSLGQVVNAKYCALLNAGQMLASPQLSEYFDKFSQRKINGRYGGMPTIRYSTPAPKRTFLGRTMSLLSRQ